MIFGTYELHDDDAANEKMLSLCHYVNFCSQRALQTWVLCICII